eukprot:SAG31_NODE_1507_length_8072_cov_7.986580_1_plen_68_part_00
MVAACAPRVVDGLCGGTPCLVLGECSATAVSWLWDSESIDGRPASNMQVIGLIGLFGLAGFLLDWLD